MTLHEVAAVMVALFGFALSIAMAVRTMHRQDAEARAVALYHSLHQLTSTVYAKERAQLQPGEVVVPRSRVEVRFDIDLTTPEQRFRWKAEDEWLERHKALGRVEPTYGEWLL